jgi:hypothetical protein
MAFNMKTSRRDFLFGWLRGGLVIGLLGACGWLAWRRRDRDCTRQCRLCSLARTCSRAQRGVSDEHAKP